MLLFAYYSVTLSKCEFYEIDRKKQKEEIEQQQAFPKLKTFVSVGSNTSWLNLSFPVGGGRLCIL